MIINKTGKDMLYLIWCALHEVTPDAKRVADNDILFDAFGQKKIRNYLKRLLWY